MLSCKKIFLIWYCLFGLLSFLKGLVSPRFKAAIFCLLATVNFKSSFIPLFICQKSILMWTIGLSNSTRNPLIYPRWRHEFGTQSALALALSLTLSSLDLSRIDSTLDSDYVLCLNWDLGLCLCSYFIQFGSVQFCSVLFYSVLSFCLVYLCLFVACSARFVTAFCFTWPKCLIPYNVV